MRQITAKLAEVVDRYTTMTAVRGGLDVPGRCSRSTAPRSRIGRSSRTPAGRQLHVAETEKYPHVTYFFNGGEEEPYEGELREIAAVAARRADLRQEARDERARVHRAVPRALGRGHPAFAIINFANPDMVGHTGVIPAAVKAVETADECLGRVVEAVHATGGACIVTADHGNADEMLEEDGSPDTAHSLNPVPFIVTARRRLARRRGHPGRRRADRAGPARAGAAGADDGPVAGGPLLTGRPEF